MSLIVFQGSIIFSTEGRLRLLELVASPILIAISKMPVVSDAGFVHSVFQTMIPICSLRVRM